MDRTTSSWHRHWAALYLVGVLVAPALSAQVLTLDEARARALEASPDLSAAREAVLAAASRRRQAGAFPNPTISYAREQTSRAGRTDWQHIGLVEQRLDFFGPRGARQNAAGYRHDAAMARLRVLEADVLFGVTRAYAVAVAADQRAARAAEAAAAFGRAERISAQRLAQGDESGYANRRIRLEAARYGALHADALRQSRDARLALGVLLSSNADSSALLGQQLSDSVALPALDVQGDSLRALALRSRAELRAVDAEVAAASAEASAFRREAFPTPTAGIGFKREKGSTDPSPASGFVLQLSLPLPLWDRKQAGSQALQADARERGAEAAGLRRRIAQQVDLAWAGVQSVEIQLAVLRPQLGAEARAALTAAETAYAEGEILLLEWLDAVRAYQEAEASFASLQADYIIQRAALERAVGLRLQ